MTIFNNNLNMVEVWNTSTNGFNVEYTNILYVLSALSSIAAIVVKNSIVSILFLVCLFALIGMALCLSGFNFIGLSYIMIYIGAVSILFIFILMLVNIRTSELLSNNIKILALAGLLILSLVYIYFSVYSYSDSAKGGEKYLLSLNNLKLLFFWGDEDNTPKEEDAPWRLFYYFIIVQFLMSINWDGLYTILGYIASIGSILYTVYSIWLMIVSYILLLTLTGAILVTLSPEYSNSSYTSNLDSTPSFRNSSLNFNQRRSYSTSSKIIKELAPISPKWVTGFCDGDSSFSIGMTRNKSYKTG
uniref:NADH-ubiquinone oxidoreductase chain 6 n=1 Tax=Endoconidiophora resinifera TaxID=1580851 RepID=A0A3G6XM82_9PEZI|nr:NADH dehydrogenase subunit 6 [Endoconidiophora resinifera]AZL93779.1 NADH dehydrogenase subunit 6 [Endoconidiophora resinifera]AZL93794.1 NADH dehydrogenase subunit 6 [Endoconidiophora resinifera]AZL93808.1 NADH dehydrogenase subunit 6 [Endoconidiophora resinifera]